jgi:RNA polymerase primary sigma factor
LTASNNQVKVPSHTLSNARKVWKITKEYSEKFGCDPTVSEISEILGLQQKYVEQAISAMSAKNIKSIHDPIGDEGGRTFVDTLEDHNAASIDSLLDNEKVREAIVKSLKSLSDREEMVLRLRFGINEVTDDDIHVYEI